MKETPAQMAARFCREAKAGWPKPEPKTVEQLREDFIIDGFIKTLKSTK